MKSKKFSFRRLYIACHTRLFQWSTIDEPRAYTDWRWDHAQCSLVTDEDERHPLAAVAAKSVENDLMNQAYNSYWSVLDRYTYILWSNLTKNPTAQTFQAVQRGEQVGVAWIHHGCVAKHVPIDSEKEPLLHYYRKEMNIGVTHYELMREMRVKYFGSRKHYSEHIRYSNGS
jgi:hypothetical protein